MKLTGCWRHINGAVYENQYGTRMHLLGTVKTSQGLFFNVNTTTYYSIFHKLLRIYGGNRKRALMALADSLTEIQK